MCQCYRDSGHQTPYTYLRYNQKLLKTVTGYYFEVLYQYYKNFCYKINSIDKKFFQIAAQNSACNSLKPVIRYTITESIYKKLKCPLETIHFVDLACLGTRKSLLTACTHWKYDSFILISVVR